MITLAFTRPERRLETSVAMAEDMGFRVLAAPSLEVIPGRPEDFERFGDRLYRGSVDICIFSSATAVEECFRMWGKESVEMLDSVRVASIGPATSEYLEKNGIRVDSMPDVYSSQGLVDHLTDVRGKSILIIHSDKGSEILRDGLRANGARVTELIAYRLKKTALSQASRTIIEEALAGRVEFFAFTSPLSAESFFDAAKAGGYDSRELTGNSRIAAIGEPTASALRSLGLKVDIIPDDSTFRSLLVSIKEFGRETK